MNLLLRAHENVNDPVWSVILCVIIAVGLALSEYANLFIPSPILVSSAFLAFIFAMSLIFAARFGKAFSDVESLKSAADIQNHKISEQHDLIKDSIQYAKRIQAALLQKNDSGKTS